MSLDTDRKDKAEASDAPDEGMWPTIKIVLQALLIAVVVRTFFYQPFNIPSGSMKSTLLVGDYLFVSKLSYGFSRHSFEFTIPFTSTYVRPVAFKGRYFASTPKRGDVVVFKLPTDGQTDYIKRVIGLPGDEIQMKGGVLYINGQAVKKTLVDEWEDREGGVTRRKVQRFKEILPNGVEYLVLDMGQTTQDNTEVFKVKDNHYFMMGDNRDNSTDSRFSSVGQVPYDNLVGRADLIFFSLENEYCDQRATYEPGSNVLVTVYRRFATVVGWMGCTVVNSEIRGRRIFNRIR